jgi:hypothetical protein
MERATQYRVIKDYYLPTEKGSTEWHDHEVFNNFQGAWKKMKRLKDSGLLSVTDRWWIERKGYNGIFQLPSPWWTRKLPWRVEQL